MFITDTAALRIYEAFIIPLVTYYSLTNFYHNPSRKSTLVNFENRIKKITKTDIPSMLNMWEKKSCVTVFKSLHEVYLDYVDYFQRISHNIGMWNNGILLKVPKCKLESTKKAFFYNGAILFNKLPIVKSENDFNIFYKKLEQFFIGKWFSYWIMSFP